MLPRNYKLVNVGNGELIATFTSEMTFFRTAGILQVNKPYGRDFDLMVLATLMTMFPGPRIC